MSYNHHQNGEASVVKVLRLIVVMVRTKLQAGNVDGAAAPVAADGQ